MKNETANNLVPQQPALAVEERSHKLPERIRARVQGRPRL